jgi:hypothetical protein
MKRIGVGFMVALLVSLMLVGVASAEWPPYYYAGWRDCYPPGCIPPYHYGMYGDWNRWVPMNNYNINYNYNYYNYNYNYYNNYNYPYRYQPWNPAPPAWPGPRHH